MSAEGRLDLWAGLAPPPPRPEPRAAGLRLATARLAPYLFMAPAALVVLALTIYPLFYSARVSLERRIGRLSSWTGFDNYQQLLHDPLFWNALKVTALFTATAVTIETVLGLALALALSRDSALVRRTRPLFLLPMIVAPVVVGIMFRLLYLSDTGAVSYIASLLGFEHFNVLSSESLALPAMVVMDVWEWTPFMFLMLLAGLQSLPPEPFEAARVDGAGPLRVFATLTLPMLRPVLAVALVIRTIDAFSIFDQVIVLTHGGPGVSTQVIGLLAYQTTFKFSQIGYGAAMVFAMLVLLVMASLTLLRVVRGRTQRVAF